MSDACSPSSVCCRPCFGAAVALLGVAAIAAAGFVGWSDPLSAGPSAAAASAAAPSVVVDESGATVPSRVPWRTDLAAALAESARSGEPVLVDFAAARCPPCQLMEEKTWPDPIVREALADGVIPVKLDLDAAAAQAASETYDVALFADAAFIEPRGRGDRPHRLRRRRGADRVPQGTPVRRGLRGRRRPRRGFGGPVRRRRSAAREYRLTPRRFHGDPDQFAATS